MNVVNIIGRLTKDPELYTTPSGTPCCSFNVAVDRQKRNGEDQGADFIRVAVFGNAGEACNKFLYKGYKVGILGRLQTGSYEKNGQTIYTTDVIASSVEFLTPKNHATSTGSSQSKDPDLDELPESFRVSEDDIPF